VRVAIYARVSTDKQTIKNQVETLKKWAKKMDWEVGEVYKDSGSAFQHANQKALRKLLEDCSHGDYQHVLVYDLSRLTRQGPLELMLLLKQFADKKASVYSYLDTAINVPSEFQPMLVAFYGVMGHTFSTQLSERTKVGMARAAKEGTKSGKPIGRPRKIKEAN
jgi:DNA invertase Pin-like site-specific DNA recombinase